MKYHNPANTNNNVHSFDNFSFKKKWNKILINTKVVSNWDLFKTEIFWPICHYSTRKTIKTKNKQTLFSQDEFTFLNFRTIQKFHLETLIYRVFSEFSYDEMLKSYTIKTFWWFLVEGDQTYLRFGKPVVVFFLRQKN